MPVLYVIINCVTVKITGEAQETERTTTDRCRNETTSGPHRPHGTQSDRYQSIIVIKQLYKFNFTVLYVHYQLKVTLVYILMIKKHIWCITTILRTIRQLTLSTPYTTGSALIILGRTNELLLKTIDANVRAPQRLQNLCNISLMKLN